MSRSNSSVLIVEDNLDLRELYAEALVKRGYSVYVAENGAVALDLLVKNKIHPIMILLDLMMPMMDGWEFLEIRSHNEAIKKIPVVVCTASKEDHPESVEVFLKPMALETLANLADRYNKPVLPLVKH